MPAAGALHGEIVDLHSHVLPGIDDGARDLAESLAIARSAVAAGVGVLAATPHVRWDHPTRTADIVVGVRELTRQLEAHGIPLRIVSGAEVGVDMLQDLNADELRRLTLAATGRYLLVEAPYASAAQLDTALLELRMQGLTPVIAHPERSADVVRDPERLRPLVEAGALVQVTAASLDGSARGLQRVARRLLDAELVHLVASDAHAPTVRRASVSSALDAIPGEDLRRWLAVDVPRAIVDGRAIPPRPADPARRRLFRRQR